MPYQEIIKYFALAILGMVPSLIWLYFYLRQDARPEPNSMVISVFLMGMITIFFAAVLQIAIIALQARPNNFLEIFDIMNQQPIHPIMLVNLVLFAPITEELFKYLVVKIRVMENAAFDEPLDLMLYMVIAGLGFAAGENILYLIQSQTIVSDLIGRFITATLLHTLTAAYLGYFLALAIHKSHLKTILRTIGFAVAFFIHGLYNYIIISSGKISEYLAQNTSGNIQSIASAGITLLFLTVNIVIIIAMFHNLKKHSGDCKI